MAIILNIETSGSVCSVALTDSGNILFQQEDESGMNHSTALGPFVEKCMDELARRELRLDAVAVSLGPGSYTGLRIGLSMAKGIAFAQNIPLIGVPTMKILACKAMFLWREWTGEEIFVPMIDARRMEVWTTAYDFALNELIPSQPLILEEDSYKQLFESGRKVLFMGSGSPKAQELLKYENAEWLGAMNPYARDMMALAEKAFREKDFLDTAYSTPLYLKEYQTTQPKKKI